MAENEWINSLNIDLITWIVGQQILTWTRFLKEKQTKAVLIISIKVYLIDREHLDGHNQRHREVLNFEIYFWRFSWETHDAIYELRIIWEQPGLLLRWRFANENWFAFGTLRKWSLKPFRSKRKSMRIYFRRSIVIPCRCWVIERCWRKGEKSCQLMMENVRFYLLKSDARHAYTLNACYTRCPFLPTADFIQFRFTWSLESSARLL